MKIGQRQQAILDLASSKEGGRFSFQEAVDVIGRFYFHNERKHTGEVLNRMIRRGLISRVRRAEYQLTSKTPDVPEIDPNQKTLF